MDRDAKHDEILPYTTSATRGSHMRGPWETEMAGGRCAMMSRLLQCLTAMGAHFRGQMLLLLGKTGAEKLPRARCGVIEVQNTLR
jgi:hypothetical protein